MKVKATSSERGRIFEAREERRGQYLSRGEHILHHEKIVWRTTDMTHYLPFSNKKEQNREEEQQSRKEPFSTMSDQRHESRRCSVSSGQTFFQYPVLQAESISHDHQEAQQLCSGFRCFASPSSFDKLLKQLNARASSEEQSQRMKHQSSSRSSSST